MMNYDTCHFVDSHQITFKTKIYHPNIDEKGQVCLPIISPEHWKPATKTDQGVGRHNSIDLEQV